MTMGNSILHIMRRAVMLTAALIGCALCAGARPFSEMSAREVSDLLAGAPATASATDAANASAATSQASLPVSLTAIDMVSKVYGVADPDANKEECMRQTSDALRLVPQEDEGALWLEGAGGYLVDYYGMIPDVSAMVRFADDNSGASDFGFFFLFPYTDASKAESIRDQADFCGTLLQEMADKGLSLDLNTASSDLFEALGEHDGSLINVRLLDDNAGSGDGRFILILSVEPRSFSPADDTMTAL